MTEHSLSVVELLSASFAKNAGRMAYEDTSDQLKFGEIHDIALGDFSSWGDAERIAVNVSTLYREYEGKLAEPVNPLELFALMADVRACQRKANQSRKQ